ncbi:cytochrome P450 [Aspergillus ambiguus]|uniref:putative cytochrome P450 monooxygenase n=1 Tax=Aspergillus ambiguus TaxID=176160 RepID=UPI003CCDFD5C
MVTYPIVVLSILIASIGLLCNYARLNTIPGPVLARLSDFWRAYAQTSPKFGHHLQELHDNYGTIVCIGPNLASVSDPAAIVPVRAHRSRGSPSYPHQYLSERYRLPDVRQYEGIIDPAARILVDTLRRFHTLDLITFLHFFAADFTIRLAAHNPHESMASSLSDATDRFPKNLRGWFTLPGAEHLLFKGPASRLKRGRDVPIVCRNLRFAQYLSWRDSSIPRHAWTTPGDVHHAIEDDLDYISKAFTSTFLYLAKYPTVMETLRREIIAAFSRNRLSAPALWCDICHLEYLEAVMKECLRLSPNIQHTGDLVVPDEGADVSGCYLPQGTTIRCYPPVVRNNDNIYGANVHIFDPVRWLNSTPEQRVYMTQCLVPLRPKAFEHPKVCAAWLELKKVIVLIVRKFDLHLPGAAVGPVQDTPCTHEDLPSLLVRVAPRSSDIAC